MEKQGMGLTSVYLKCMIQTRKVYIGIPKPLELLPTEREGIENGKNYRSCKRKLYLSNEVSEDQGPLGGELLF